MRQTLTINTNTQKYTVTTEMGFFKHMGSTLANLFPDKKIAVITDDTVLSIYEEELRAQMDKSGINWTLISLPPGRTASHLMFCLTFTASSWISN